MHIGLISSFMIVLLIADSQIFASEDKPVYQRSNRDEERSLPMCVACKLCTLICLNTILCGFCENDCVYLPSCSDSVTDNE